MEAAERAKKLLKATASAIDSHALKGWDEEASYSERVNSFRADLWPLSCGWGWCPPVVALFGWSCCDVRQVRCSDCEAVLPLNWPSSSDARRTVIASFIGCLQSAHHSSCHWRSYRVSPSRALCPSAHSAVSDFHSRLDSLLSLSISPSCIIIPPSLPSLSSLLVSPHLALLAACGWRKSSSSSSSPSLVCILCPRHISLPTDNTPFDPVKQHRVHCPFRNPRSHVWSVAQKISPEVISLTPEDKPLLHSNTPQLWLWLLNLLAGTGDIDPIIQ